MMVSLVSTAVVLLKGFDLGYFKTSSCFTAVSLGKLFPTDFLFFGLTKIIYQNRKVLFSNFYF